jgi:hypothetical protein
MRLFLSQADHHWIGLVDIEGETFKVTLTPGSATKPWTAVLESGGWVDLTEGSSITTAIQTALIEWQSGPSPLPIPLEQTFLQALKDNPNLLAQIEKVINGAT